MYKVIGLIAATAIIVTAGLANAAETKDQNQTTPVELSASEMQVVTAGIGRSGGSSSGGQINLGSYKLVFDGAGWVRQRNN